MTAPEPVRMTWQEVRDSPAYANAAPLVAAGVPWPAQWFVVRIVDGEPRVLPVNPLEQFTVIGAVDRSVTPPALDVAAVMWGDFAASVQFPPGVNNGAEPYAVTVWASTIDEAVDVARDELAAAEPEPAP